MYHIFSNFILMKWKYWIYVCVCFPMYPLLEAVLFKMLWGTKYGFFFNRNLNFDSLTRRRLSLSTILNPCLFVCVYIYICTYRLVIYISLVLIFEIFKLKKFIIKYIRNLKWTSYGERDPKQSGERIEMMCIFTRKVFLTNTM